jgi:hypothetical protein
VAGLFILICALTVGDYESRTKFWMAVAFLVTQVLMFVQPWLSLLTLAVFCLVVGAFTFTGINKRR